MSRSGLRPASHGEAWLKGQDLEKVMGRSLCKWIGWDYKFA